jgi:hypothetical protein
MIYPRVVKNILHTHSGLNVSCSCSYPRLQTGPLPFLPSYYDLSPELLVSIGGSNAAANLSKTNKYFSLIENLDFDVGFASCICLIAAST